MPKSNHKSAPWIQFIIAIAAIVVAMFQWYSWQRKHRELNAKYKLVVQERIDSLQKLAEARIAVADTTQEARVIQKELAEIDTRLEEQVTKLDIEHVALNRERDKILKAMDWDELFK